MHWYLYTLNLKKKGPILCESQLVTAFKKCSVQMIQVYRLRFTKLLEIAYCKLYVLINSVRPMAVPVAVT